jgi:L,D-transpeptidase YcbB
MKNLILSIVACGVFASCQYIAGEHDASDSTATVDNSSFDDQLLSAPDTSINPTNAYNTLFIDSAIFNKYITDKKISPADAQAMKGFYNMRNYQYAWFAPDGMTEQGRAFWNAYTYGKSHGQKDSANSKSLSAKMDTIVDIDTLMIAANDTGYQQTELDLTMKFINYYRNSDKESLLHQLPLSYLIPVKKSDPLVMADSVLSFKTSASIDSTNKPYIALKQTLAMYDSIAGKGGWQPIAGPVKMLKKGAASPAVAGIKRRLQVTGEYPGRDTTAKFTDSLELAVRSFQERSGFKPDGVVTDSLLMVLNVPVEQRIEQILINMNRMAWMPPQVKDNFVAVNIPEFMLQIHEGDSIPVEMEVVVGKEGTNTMMFSGDLNEVVFNPTWNLPASIVKNEVLPAMKSDPNYLKKKHMEIVSKNDSLPEIKQLPGEGNALGRVKFLFPNSYDIYLHDTEAKGLFAQNKRAFSHGCIRVADPQKLSEYVLQNNSSWSPDKIRAEMNSNKEQHVAVKKPLPVVITYFTAFVDEQGYVHFRDDIYSHDKRTASMMFSPITRTV